VAAKKRIDLALQGGGAHGAFTWGVLDRLLEDKRLEIEAISGTSAGAMNAVVLADGLDRGGQDGARVAL
jgi:NTE family protein